MKAIFAATSALVLMAGLGLQDAQAGPSVRMDIGVFNGGGGVAVENVDVDAESTLPGVRANSDVDADFEETATEDKGAFGEEGPRPVFQAGIGNVDSEEAPALFRSLDAFSGRVAGIRVENSSVPSLTGTSASAQSVLGGR